MKKQTKRATPVPKPSPRARARKPAKPALKPRKPKPLSDTMTWEGLSLSVAYEPHWLPPSDDYPGQAHLEVRVIEPERAPLPITDTGYRSHFLLSGIVEEAGGPAAYVRRWLDEAARSPHWKRVRDRGRQYSLF